MCKGHQLREYLPLPHGKMPNGDHICLTDGGSDQLRRSKGALFSFYSLHPEFLGVWNSSSGPDLCVYALRMIRGVLVTATFIEAQRTTLA